MECRRPQSERSRCSRASNTPT
jgi:serine/threonine protein kinase